MTSYAARPRGRERSLLGCLLLMIVTLGFYHLYWYFAVHSEMNRFSRRGLGGLLALLLAILLAPVMPFLTAHEVGNLYADSGRVRPVSAWTGLWIILPVVGILIWFVQTNGALNRFWRD